MISSPFLQKPFSQAATGYRARACTASPGLARAALPYAHLDGVVVEDLYKLGVDTLGEELVVLKERSDMLKVKSVNIVNEYNAVRVTHRNAGDVVILSADADLLVYHSFLVALYGDKRGIELRSLHIYA